MKILHLKSMSINLDNVVLISRGTYPRQGELIKFDMAEALEKPIIKGAQVESMWPKITAFLEDDEKFVAVGDWLLVHLGKVTQMIYGSSHGTLKLHLVHVGSGRVGREPNIYKFEEAKAREVYNVLKKIPGLSLED